MVRSKSRASTFTPRPTNSATTSFAKRWSSVEIKLPSLSPIGDSGVCASGFSSEFIVFSRISNAYFAMFLFTLLKTPDVTSVAPSGVDVSLHQGATPKPDVSLGLKPRWQPPSWTSVWLRNTLAMARRFYESVSNFVYNRLGSQDDLCKVSGIWLVWFIF